MQSRPIYETAQNVSAEAVVADILATKWACRAVKMPRFTCVDYAFCRHENIISALVEIKCRPDVPWRLYDTYMISVSKLLAIDALASAMDVPALLVVQWKDALRYCMLTGLLPTLDRFYIGGRKDRDDPEDTEPVAYIPMERFKPVTSEQNL